MQPGTPVACTQLHYLVLNRRTLQRTASGSVEASVAGIKDLGTILDAYSGSLDQLVVLNWVGVVGGAELGADRTAISNLLQKIGAPPLTAAQRELINVDRSGATYSPGSAVGVAGAPAGSAFLRLGHFPACPRPCVFQNHGGMSGALRLNGVTGKYDFVFTNAVDFDTETNQTQTDFSPPSSRSRSAIRPIRSRTPAVASRASTFSILYAETLEPLATQVVYHERRRRRGAARRCSAAGEPADECRRQSPPGRWSSSRHSALPTATTSTGTMRQSRSSASAGRVRCSMR